MRRLAAEEGVLRPLFFEGDGFCRVLTEGDVRLLAGALRRAVCDTVPNDKGIMVKMAEPELMQIWLEGGRTKWHLLKEEDIPVVGAILRKLS